MNTIFDFNAFFKPYVELFGEIDISRFEFYKKIIPILVNRNKEIYVIETGTMFESSKNKTSFTLIFADLIKNVTGGKLYTVDISQDHIDMCKILTKDFSDSIEYIKSDSVTYLKSLSDVEINETDLFILDSYDLYVPDPWPSSIHHLEEFLNIYYRLNDDSILAIDDNFIPGTIVYWNWLDANGNIINTDNIPVENSVIGKAMLIDKFLSNKNWIRMDDLIHVGINNIFCYTKGK
jgi:hypothetical protein